MGEWASTEKEKFLNLSWFQCLTFEHFNTVYFNGVMGCSVVPCTFELLAYFFCTSLEFLDLGSPHMSSKCCTNAVGCQASPKSEDTPSKWPLQICEIMWQTSLSNLIILLHTWAAFRCFPPQVAWHSSRAAAGSSRAAAGSSRWRGGQRSTLAVWRRWRQCELLSLS